MVNSSHYGKLKDDDGMLKSSLGVVLLCAALLLSGCSRTPLPEAEETTLPAATVPADGDPHTVACLGSYTGTDHMDTVAVRMGDTLLTNRELQHWYWAEVAQYRQSGLSPAPDFDAPLDTQPCEIQEGVNSWQQYFLECALNRWHTANALIRHSRDNPLPTEEAYKADPEKLDKYMSQMPANKLLYGYNPFYSPNTLHQRYLDALQDTLSGTALDMARSLNYGYMYFTTLTYGLEPGEISDSGEALVSFRHILLLPGEEETGCTEQAAALLEQWMKNPKASESTFAQLASRQSRDPATATSGGLYENLRKDQLPAAFSQWCFDGTRQEGDTTLIPTDEGVHILYFVGRTEGVPSQTEPQQELLAQIRDLYPVQTDYSAIVLTPDGAEPSVSDLLYPDIAHERFPEVPLYLQQDYTGTMYGQYKITTNGCGITSLAMIASYLCDDELTPPEMCARYGRYSTQTGTAGSLFEDAPPELGFYLIKKSYDWREAREYMQEGHPVVVCQYRGYWTSGGHYLVLEKLTEDGLVQVRDSNLYNYRKLPRHKDDAFPWDTISTAGQGYWIYEKKVTAHPACTRCGDPDSVEYPLASDYLCRTCKTALIRRDAYLA